MRLPTSSLEEQPMTSSAPGFSLACASSSVIAVRACSVISSYILFPPFAPIIATALPSVQGQKAVLSYGQRVVG